MPKRIQISELLGLRFGQLVVTGPGSPSHVSVRCDCGIDREVKPKALRNGQAVSCGCLRRKRLKDGMQTTHGQNKTRTYSIYLKMVERTTDPGDEHWGDYGGRGIGLCERWEVFENFFADMGECPEGLTIERIDNDKGYLPENCKWATRREQANNRRSNRLITAHGETCTVAEWVRLSGRSVSTIHRRLNSGLLTNEQSVSSSRYVTREPRNAA